MYIDEFQAFMNVSVGFERILAEARKYNLVLAGLATPNNQSDTAEDRQLPFRDIAPALEFVCWIAVALAPLLRWINGPAVTSDQFVIQLVLFTLAVASAVSLRAYNWWIARHFG